MILTVTLNPAVDKTVYIENMKIGELNRVKAIRTDPGGKGINVSKALCSYGVEQKATGILAGMNGRYLLSLLEKFHFPKEFLMVSGETRVNLKIKDEKTNLVTEINETGPLIAKSNTEEFIKLLKEHLIKCDLIVLSGSLPDGMPSDFYAQCIRLASDMKVASILDADGEAFKFGCKALPYAIKPNLHEFERLTGKSFSNYREIRDEIKVIHETGIELVLVSLGKEGSVLSYRNKTYHASTLPVQVKSTVASGDSMVAALAYCIKKDIPLDETARITSAAGCLTAALDGSEMSEWKDIKDVYKKVYIEEI
ncbi:MAG: 1-phosphofructokinase [Clostridiaceae bacterium]|nr:1-phosphofructokinase [Clostridiaceae bacterium]